MKGTAKSAVGGTRPWTARATPNIPPTVNRTVEMTISFTAGSSPRSGASGTTRRSTPRLPMSAQRKS